MKFSWLEDVALDEQDFDIEDKVVLLPDFLFYGDMTIIYSAPKQGKSWLAYALCATLNSSEHISDIVYLDMDNPLTQLKARNVNNTLMKLPKVQYLSKSKLPVTPMEFLETIAKGAKLGEYKGLFLVLDTIKDFIDFDNPRQAKQFMDFCVRIRDAGATIILLHHSTKQERGISGNQAFINTPDNIYELKQNSRVDSVLNYSLRVTHARGMVKDCQWSVDTKTLSLTKYDAVAVGLNESDAVAVEKALVVLRENPDGISESKLILSMGFSSRTDRNGKRIAKEMTGHYWMKEAANAKQFKYYIEE